jgi:hypothetical protein
MRDAARNECRALIPAAASWFVNFSSHDGARPVASSRSKTASADWIRCSARAACMSGVTDSTNTFTEAATIEGL